MGRRSLPTAYRPEDVLLRLVVAVGNYKSCQVAIERSFEVPESK